MLATYLHGLISKFIILEDDLEEPGHVLFKYLITETLNNTELKILFLQFNFNLHKNISKQQLSNVSHSNMTLLSSQEVLDQLTTLVNTKDKDSVIIIDSLVHMVWKLGARNCYKVLITINKQSGFKQILTQLHSDLLREDDAIQAHLSHLASLLIKMERQFGHRPRLSYIYKKGRGKVVRAIEEFTIIDGKLTMSAVAEVDVKTILANSTIETDVNSLTTFNIELNERDKASRSQLDLPFLPKELHQNQTDKSENQSQGEIHYVFDAGDDWDAEDPDDDLDI